MTDTIASKVEHGTAIQVKFKGKWYDALVQEYSSIFNAIYCYYMFDDGSSPKTEYGNFAFFDVKNTRLIKRKERKK